MALRVKPLYTLSSGLLVAFLSLLVFCLQWICCQNDSNIFLLCKCFVYLHMFSLVIYDIMSRCTSTVSTSKHTWGNSGAHDDHDVHFTFKHVSYHFLGAGRKGRTAWQLPLPCDSPLGLSELLPWLRLLCPVHEPSYHRKTGNRYIKHFL